MRVGVIDVQLPVRSQNTLGDLTGVTPTVCVVTDQDQLLNDHPSPLAIGDTYTFCIALGGEDRTNGGYTFGGASSVSSTVSITNQTDILRLNVSNSDLGSASTYFDEAAFIAVFMLINSASKYQLVKLAYVPRDGSDWVVAVNHKPMRSAISRTLSFLQTAFGNTDDYVGDRNPYGFTFEAVTPTTQDIVESYDISQVNIDTNSGPPFRVRTTCAAGISFQLLLNDIKTVVRAAGGMASKYDDPSGNIVTEGEYGLATAQAIMRGNQPVIVTYAPDGNNDIEEATYLALRTQNDDNLRMNWSKSHDTPVNITYQAAVLDSLLVGCFTKTSRIVKTAA